VEVPKLDKAEQARFSTNINNVAWDMPGGGNPVMPGYFADPTLFYDEESATFFSYATMDGIDYNWQRDPHVAYSKDMLSWEYAPLQLPSFWPAPTDTHPLEHAIWAPSIVKNSGNGKYYLTYSIDMSTYVAYSVSPFGPWTNATTGTGADTAPLLQDGKVWGGADAFDGQLFLDTDGLVYMVVGGGGKSGIVALEFDVDNTVSVDNHAPGMTDGQVYKYKRITGLAEYNEGPIRDRRTISTGSAL
jgi:beta-xylosidase